MSWQNITKIYNIAFHIVLCDNFYFDGLKLLLTHCVQLKSLSLLLSTLSNDNLIELFKIPNQISGLTFDSCDIMNTTTVISILTFCTKLQNLKVSGRKLVNKTAIDKFVSDNHLIVKCDLRGCW